MRTTTLLLSSAVLATGLFTTQVHAVEGLSANVGVTSNYVWRGVSQTNDQAAISGGIDYAAESGFYVGTWASNVDFGDDTSAEVDFYAGYGFEAGDIAFDVGYIFYGFPGCGECDASEVYASASWEALTVGAYVTADSEAGASFGDANYIYADLAFEVSEGLALGFHYGIADSDGGSSVSDYGISLSKNDFTLSVTDVDDNAVEPNLLVAISYSIAIDL